MSTPCAADAKSDFYIQQATDRFFTLPFDARSLAMGGASALTCSDAACIYMNPAALGFLTAPSVGMSAGLSTRSGGEFLGDDEIELEEWAGYLSGAIPLLRDERDSSLGTVSLAFSRYAGNTDDSLSTTPDGHRRSIGYGIAVSEQIALGYAFHFLDDQLRNDLSDVHSHGRFYHDFAMQWVPDAGLTLGGGFRLGIGQTDTEDFELGSDGVSHLRQYTANLALEKRWEQLSLAIGGHYTRQTSRADALEFSEPVVIDGNESGNDYKAQVGVEYRPTESIALRTGFGYRFTQYRFTRPNLDELSGRLSAPSYSLGLGYAFSLLEALWRLDYGVEYSEAGYGDWEHILSLTVSL